MSVQPPPPSTDNARIIDAIHGDRLADLEHPEASAVCGAIGRKVADNVEDAIERLAAAGISAEVEGDPTAPAQRHSATLRMADAAAAIDAARVLEANGYRPWEPIDGAAESVLRHLRNSLTAARTDDVTMVLELRWPTQSTLAARLPAVAIPNENDFDAVALPTRLWPLYLIVRPLRLIAERLGLRPASGHGLGPFLSTPTDLIAPLLDLAGVGPTDVLVDLGCGDARVLRHAVSERGCRGVGVESNPDLVGEARRLVAEDGLGDRITIVKGDAAERLEGPAAEGTVYFLFVPAYSVPSVASRVLAQSAPGTRMVVHEQHPLPDLGSDLTPQVTSVPLLVGRGVTVAHLLVVGGEDD